MLDAHIVVVVRLFRDLQLVHDAHEDGAVGISLQSACLACVTESRRDVRRDLRQQPRGGGTRIDVELEIEESGIDAF